MRKPRAAAPPASSSSTRPTPPPTAGTRSRTPTPTPCSTSSARTRPASTRSPKAGSSARSPSRFSPHPASTSTRPRPPARQRSFQPIPLKATLSAQGQAQVSTINSHNVVGYLPGKKYPDETVIYSAHWDHLGIGKPDERGDTIYNGALDNATGIAQLIEQARAFAHEPRTDRSVVFLAVTAEEKGLLGSEYYAQNPLFPAAKTAGVINTDGGSIYGPAKNFTISGNAKLGLLDMLIAEGKKQGRYYSPDPHPEAGHFYRSDHFSFAKVGVPAISFGDGNDLVNGGTERGEALAKEYTDKHYHQPSDEWLPTWNFEGMAEDANLLHNLGRDLANSRDWPDWSPDSEFRAKRDAAAASGRAPLLPRPRRRRASEGESLAQYGASRSNRSSSPFVPSQRRRRMADLIFYTNPQSRGRIVRWMLEELGATLRDRDCPLRPDEERALSRGQPDGQGAGDQAPRPCRHRVRGDLRLSRRRFPAGRPRPRDDEKARLLPLAVLRRRAGRGRGLEPGDGLDSDSGARAHVRLRQFRQGDRRPRRAVQPARLCLRRPLHRGRRLCRLAARCSRCSSECCPSG